MKYEKTTLTAKQLQTLLENDNPRQYDEIHITFKTTVYDEEEEMELPIRIELSNLNDPVYEINKFTGVYGKQLRNWKYKAIDLEYKLLHRTLQEDEEINYNNIKKVTAWYYTNQQETTYTGAKLENITNKEELKKFFLDNKSEIKDEFFGGWRVTGIGEKKLKIKYNYYTWDTVWRVYNGDIESYSVGKVLFFLQNNSSK